MSIPVGSIMPYAGVISESNRNMLFGQGWLLCDGSEVDRTNYANLFSVIATLYGGGNGVDTFNLPNYQGQFLRGVSNDSGVDPDAETRTGQVNGAGTNGTAFGNQVGTFQADEIRSHSHPLSTWKRSFQASDDSDRPFDDKGTIEKGTGAFGGSETRPTNVYVNYIIRFQE